MATTLPWPPQSLIVNDVRLLLAHTGVSVDNPWARSLATVLCHTG